MEVRITCHSFDALLGIRAYIMRQRPINPAYVQSAGENHYMTYRASDTFAELAFLKFLENRYASYHPQIMIGGQTMTEIAHRLASSMQDAMSALHRTQNWLKDDRIAEIRRGLKRDLASVTKVQTTEEEARDEQ